MDRKHIAAFASISLLLAPLQASAHHAMGGGVPDSLSAGLLSGFGHPVIGVDHFAFIVLVGLGVAFAPRRWLTPLAFVLATVAGCLLQVSGVTLPLAEIVITASVVLLGAMVVSGKSYPPQLYLGLFTLSGLFHGWAYGGSIVGAELTPLLAYLAGFATLQYAIIAGVTWVVLSFWSATGPAALRPRLAGAVAAGVGLAFLIENLEGLVLT
jgi:urease accessory protein